MSCRAEERLTSENGRDASSLYSSGRTDRHSLQRLAEEGLNSQLGKRRLGLVHYRESRGRGYRRCFTLRVGAVGRHGGEVTRTAKAELLSFARIDFRRRPLSQLLSIRVTSIQPSDRPENIESSTELWTKTFGTDSASAERERAATTEQGATRRIGSRRLDFLHFARFSNFNFAHASSHY